MDKFHTTFGSDYRDDGYYLEYRDKVDNPYSFLTFWIQDDQSLKVAIGEGEGAVVMSVSELQNIIANSTERLTQAKNDWDAARDKFGW